MCSDPPVQEKEALAAARRMRQLCGQVAMSDNATNAAKVSAIAAGGFTALNRELLSKTQLGFKDMAPAAQTALMKEQGKLGLDDQCASHDHCNAGKTLWGAIDDFAKNFLQHKDAGRATAEVGFHDALGEDAAGGTSEVCSIKRTVCELHKCLADPTCHVGRHASLIAPLLCNGMRDRHNVMFAAFGSRQLASPPPLPPPPSTLQ